MMTEKQKEYDEAVTRFNKVYANLPIKESRNVICVLDMRDYGLSEKEPIGWNICNLEIKGKTKLSERILEYLKRMEFI